MVIPFNIFIIDSSIYVRNYLGNNALLHAGDQILSINSIPTVELLRRMEDFKTSDGYNKSHKYYAIEYAFTIFNYYIFGQQNSYAITYKNPQGEIKDINLTAIKRPVMFDFNNRQSIDSSRIMVKGAHINLQKTDINAQTYLIDFNSFAGPRLRKSYRQIFSYLRKNKAENLIIDLRDNGGGNAFGGYNFLKYLLPNSIQALNLSRKPNLTLLNPSFKAGFFERITPLLFMANPLQYPSKQGWNHTFLFLKHFRNAYKGPLYVLTNGQTFSMAAVTTTLLKNKTKAIIIGEETGGSSYGSRGMAQGTIVLPHSKNRIHLNLYQLKYGQKPDIGRGIMPHHVIGYSFYERQMKLDKELEMVKQLILTK